MSYTTKKEKLFVMSRENIKSETNKNSTEQSLVFIIGRDSERQSHFEEILQIFVLIEQL